MGNEMSPKGGYIHISRLDEKTSRIVREIWGRNMVAVIRKRGTGWSITEVNEKNDDLSSYGGKKVVES
jgi:hypothetical protein